MGLSYPDEHSWQGGTQPSDEDTSYPDIIRHSNWFTLCANASWSGVEFIG